MKIEIIQTRTVLQTVGGKSCKDCEEEEAQKKLQEQRLAEEDRVSLSGASPLGEKTASHASAGGPNHNGEEGNSGAGNQAGPRAEADLSQEEKQALSELKTRDREVRAHEQAHLAAAGPYAKGPPSYEFQTGPDGKRYAVGGEVQIDTSEVSGNPQATLAKAQTIKRAATAPANPSAQDRQVASQASRMEIKARQEIQEQRTEEQEQTGETSSTTSASSAGPSSSIKESQQTSGTSQPAEEGSSNNKATGESGTNAFIQNALEKFSTSTGAGKGNLLDIVS